MISPSYRVDQIIMILQLYPVDFRLIFVQNISKRSKDTNQGLSSDLSVQKALFGEEIIDKHKARG